MDKMPGTFSDFAQLDERAAEKFIGELCNLTEDFCLMELKGFLQKCADDPRPASEARKAISVFRYGQADNLWEQVNIDTITVIGSRSGWNVMDEPNTLTLTT